MRPCCDYSQKARAILNYHFDRISELTSNNASFRPHQVDLTVTSWHAEGADAAPKQVQRVPVVSMRRLNRGRTQVAGAVRLSADTRPARLPHLRKMSAGLLCVASGILWTTNSTGRVDGPAGQTPMVASGNLAPAVPPPRTTFFFDDASDALADSRSAASLSQTSTVTGSSASGTLTGVHDAAAGFAILDDLDDLTPAGLSDDGLKTVTLSTLVDHPSLAAVRDQAIAPEGSVSSEVKVAAGDTLSGILHRYGVKGEQMPALLTDTVVKQYLTKLKIGQKLDVIQEANGDFHSLTAKVGHDRRITVRRSANGFAAASIDLPVEKERVVTSGTIEQSLYLAAEKAKLKQSTIMELADIFQWELDFARDIRQGDQFSVVYDRLYREGKYIGDGDILAAEFIRGGKHFQAVRFTTDDGVTAYYSPDGQSKRRTFLRHPVDVVRITSRFSTNRLHPVLHKIRAHRGVDYGAPIGTPIMATADGGVTFSGKKGAYGNVVILQHGQKFSTLYAHMSRISDKAKVGARVRQGDVIGYVGKTGRVTGAHLYYEFRVNGKHVDPLKVDLPAAQPIAARYRDELRAVSDEMIAQMRSVIPRGARQLAAVGGTVDDAVDALPAE